MDNFENNMFFIITLFHHDQLIKCTSKSGKIMEVYADADEQFWGIYVCASFGLSQT